MKHIKKDSILMFRKWESLHHIDETERLQGFWNDVNICFSNLFHLQGQMEFISLIETINLEVECYRGARKRQDYPTLTARALKHQD